MTNLKKVTKWIADTFWGKLISSATITVLIRVIENIKINIDMETWKPYLEIILTLFIIYGLISLISWLNKKYKQKADKSDILDISGKADKSQIESLEKKFNTLSEKLENNFQKPL